MIEAGGQMIDVRGSSSSRGNSPDFKTLISNTNIQSNEIRHSPQFAQPWIRSGTTVNSQTVERRVGGVGSINPELLTTSGMNYTQPAERRVGGIRSINPELLSTSGIVQEQPVERKVGGIRSINPELLKGTFDQTSELKVTNNFTKSMVSTMGNSAFQTSTSNGAIRIGGGRSVSPIGHSQIPHSYKRA